MLVRFIYIAVHKHSLLTFTDVKYSIVQTQHTVSIHYTANGHLRCFCFEAITFFYIYLHVHTCISLGNDLGVELQGIGVCLSSILPAVKLLYFPKFSFQTSYQFLLWQLALPSYPRKSFNFTRQNY